MSVYLLYSRVDTYCQAVNKVHLIDPIWLITASFLGSYSPLSDEMLSQVTQMYSTPPLKMCKTKKMSVQSSIPVFQSSSPVQ